MECGSLVIRLSSLPRQGLLLLPLRHLASWDHEPREEQIQDQTSGRADALKQCAPRGNTDNESCRLGTQTQLCDAEIQVFPASVQTLSVRKA